jgi:hypothetical protein
MAGRNFNRIAPGHIDFQLKGIRVFINEHYLLEASTLNLSSPGKIVSISPACRGKYHRGVPIDNEPPPFCTPIVLDNIGSPAIFLCLTRAGAEFSVFAPGTRPKFPMTFQINPVNGRRIMRKSSRGHQSRKAGEPWKQSLSTPEKYPSKFDFRYQDAEKYSVDLSRPRTGGNLK